MATSVPFSSDTSRAVRADLILIGAALVLGVLKLWLVAGFTLQAVGHANHDDELFVRLAEFLRAGQWLGPYDQFTLAKGPMFSIGLALTSALGWPLLTAQHVFYLVACFALVWALRPLITSRGWLIALLLALMFNPATLDQEMHSRVLRQNILPALCFILLAWLIAWQARRDRPITRILPWSVAAAVALPAFWLTREEGVWFLPALAVPGAFVVWGILRSAAPRRGLRLAVFLLPVIGGIGGVQRVASLNDHYYGVRTTCEFKEPHFKDAFGALLRLKSDSDIPYTPVTREMREHLYQLSPSFARLQPYFEGPAGIAWANVCSFVTGRPAADREIVIGWTMWALRRAVVEYGGVTSGAAAAEYYRQMAAEINAAADAGLIAAGPRRSGFLPPLGPQYFRPWLESFGEAASFLVRFATLGVIPTYSVGSEEELRRFAAMTHETLSPTRAEAPPPTTRPFGLRGQIATTIIHGYQALGPWLSGAAALAWLFALGTSAFRRRLTFTTCLATGLIGSLGAMLAIVALINVTSFPSLNSGYFTACDNVLILFIFIAPMAARETWAKRRAV